MGVSDPKGKKLIRDPRIACDMLNGGICNGVPYFREENMERLPETSDIVYMDGTGREKSKEQTPDVVFCYHGKDRNIIISFQNQKYMSLIMPVRESLSASLLYERQIQERKNELKKQKMPGNGAEFLSGVKAEDRFSPVLGIVFYYGEEPWSSAVRLHEMLDFPPDFPKIREFCPDYKVNVIHGGNVDPKNFRTGLRQLFELLPYAADKKAMMAYIAENPSHFDNLDEECCEMMAAFLGCNMLAEGKRQAYLNQKGGYDMCTAMEDLKREGIEIGEKRGIAVGEERGIHKASDAILTLVNCMLGNEDAAKIPLLRENLKLRQEMMEKYQVQL